MTDIMGRVNCELPPRRGSSEEHNGTGSNGANNCYDANGMGPIKAFHEDKTYLNDHEAKSSPKQSKSPRCEAFVMTGDKMLNLDPKISPCYAKMKQDQLPPVVEVYNGDVSSKKRGPFDDFPSMHHKLPNKHRRFQEENVPASQSEHHIGYSGSENPIEGEYSGDGQAETSTAKGNMDAMTSRHYSTSTLPENLVHIGNVNSCTNGVETGASKFIATQSTPNSPAKGMLDSSNAASKSRGIPSRVGPTARSNELSSNPEAITRLAFHLFSLQAGFRISDVAGFLIKTDDASLKVSHEFLALFNFAGKRLDTALREFLDHVQLAGESSDRARLLAHFSSRYQECNPALFGSADEIHALTCALILLNTDLHGPNPGKKMTSREFVNNLLHTQYSYDRNVLKTLYNSIKETPFKYQSEVQQRKSTAGMAVNGNSLLRGSLLINPNEQIDYKHGWVLKKSVYDSDGKRTPFGRRKWQMFYGTIRGMVLYLHKDENGFSRSQHEIFNNCIRLHHSYAEIPKDYNKRQHVIRLRTANFGEFLFQTSEPDEVVKWINSLNYVAAAFSTPVLPSPVSSTGAVVFRKPMMPSIPTTLSISEQLHAHQERLEEMSEKLDKLREEAPSIKAKGKAVYDYFYRERYLDKERERYTAYVQILSEKLGATSQADISSLSSKKNSLVALRHHQTVDSGYGGHPLGGQFQFRQNGNVNGSSDTFSSTSKSQQQQRIVAEEQMEQ